jgi:membrane associated rhomboid family serine protease
MIPLRDDNPTVLWPIFTVAFILANVGVFFYQSSLFASDERLAEKFILQMGMIPAALTRGRVPGAGGYYTLVTSMFLHGGLLHLGGNMLYLWIFGNNIEDSLGHLRFIFFYLIVGVVAAATHIYFNPGSTVPTIGASGAISGILGAYLMLFPNARIKTLVPLGIFLTVFYFPAWVLLLFWIGFQFLYQALDPIDPAAGGVAYAAHIGGFVAGFVLIHFFRKYKRRAQYRTR